MGVYIKDMKMPTSCADCPCGDVFHGYKCRLKQKSFDRYALENVQDWCPLVPVPPHGDLIDRHDLKCKEISIDYDEWDDTFDDGVLFVTNLIDNAPTIIPASEEDE